MARYSFEPKSGRYRNRATGRFVRESAVRDIVDSVADGTSALMASSTDRLRDGQLSLADWQSEMMRLTKLSHAGAHVMAAGGRDQMSPAKWGRLGRALRDEYGRLRDFARQIQDGTQPLDGRMAARARLYGQQARVQFELVRAQEDASRGYTEERSFLAVAKHCALCVTEAGKGWVPIGTLRPIGARTCLSNDRCSIRRRIAPQEQVAPPVVQPEPVPATAQPGAFTRAEDAVKWLTDRGVHIANGSPRPVTLGLLNDAAREIAKFPPKVIDALKRERIRLDLLANHGITSHPSMSHLAGVTPRGWPSGSTWDSVPGAGATAADGTAIVVVNRLKEGHGSANLILHEHGHSSDFALGSNGTPASKSKAWQRIHEAEEWPNTYEASYAEESWAESFAKYLDSEESRSQLSRRVRRYFNRITR